jgi:UDP-2,4-diacetamido-2,4,6-trideoxy-beta-L-altropyranose hydrolase
VTKIVFRTDASHGIGSGHVVRCLTLADGLMKAGAKVSFVCREHEGNLCELVEERGIEVVRLPPESGQQAYEFYPAHAAWLMSTWEDDAARTLDAICAQGTKPDWLVVDHYALEERWHRALRPAVGRILAIDDVADRRHDCDLLLDQNLVANMYNRYERLVPASCDLLLGPEYALLQPAYSELRSCTPDRRGPVRRILVFFGGADGDNLTGLAIDAVLGLGRPDLEVDIVVSPGSPNYEGIRRQVKGHANLHLHGRLPTLAMLMMKADLAIGACGATNWERLSLGLPAIVVTVAENQRPVAQELHRCGLIRWLGHRDEVSEDSLREAMAGLMAQGLPVDWSIRCRAVVDGFGLGRVIDRMGASSTVQRQSH